MANQNDRRMIGALLRIPFQATVAQIKIGLQATGYTDLSPAHFVVFQHIRPEGSHSIKLAEQAQITKQSMGYLIDYLEVRGYVERVPDPNDRRAKIVRLTERGWALDRTAREIMRQIEAEWATILGQDRFDQLCQILRDLIAALEK